MAKKQQAGEKGVAVGDRSSTAAEGQSPLIRQMLDLVPIAWLVLVLAAFWDLTTFQPQRVRDQAPLVSAADAVFPRLLAVLMVVAIIRYFSLRSRSSLNPAASSADPSEGRDSP